jgi:DNA-binding CsgD family transcriptional regulator
MSRRPTRHAFPRAGILALTAALEVVYINREAQQLCNELKQQERGPETPGLPQSVELAVAEADHGKESPVRLVFGEGDRSITLQAFTVPTGDSEAHSIIIVIMERMTRGLQQPPIDDELGFTGREKEVLNLLRQGYTNKEIAAELGISLQTVKKHVSSILLKSRKSNRTSMLAGILAPSPDRGNHEVFRS